MSCCPVASLPLATCTFPDWSTIGPVNGDQPPRIFAFAVAISFFVGALTDGPYGASSIGDGIALLEKPSE